MQNNYIKEREKGKHLSLSERGEIEGYVKLGLTIKEIATRIGVCKKTIQRELKRGAIELLNSDYTTRKEYAADVAHNRYIANQRAKQGYLKIGNNIKLADEIERLIIEEKYSPYASMEKLRLKYDVNFCLKTLYNYIEKRIFYRLNKSHLPYKKKYSNRYIGGKRIRKIGGMSIEKRSELINKREELGHWEMDTVIGKRGTKACLLVLTERVSRKEIIIKLEEKKSKSVVDAIRGLKKRFKKSFNERFRSITSDNGSEFMDAKSIEKLGIKYFYAHSYSSYERGSNESNNKLIRRYIKKSTDIGRVSRSEIKKIEQYMNSYPRKIFNGRSANDVYHELFA